MLNIGSIVLSQTNKLLSKKNYIRKKLLLMYFLYILCRVLYRAIWQKRQCEYVKPSGNWEAFGWSNHDLNKLIEKRSERLHVCRSENTLRKHHQQKSKWKRLVLRMKHTCTWRRLINCIQKLYLRHSVTFWTMWFYFFPTI